jgi:hypothetical protein
MAFCLILSMVSGLMENFGFKCITMEADLMCELLKHGAKPFDDIIQQSSMIRMCALGLTKLKGHQSISPAAVMLVRVCLHPAPCWQNVLNFNMYIYHFPSVNYLLILALIAKW